VNALDELNRILVEELDEPETCTEELERAGILLDADDDLAVSA
jgi:hypothetical protein